MMRDYEVVLFTLRKTAMKQSFFLLLLLGVLFDVTMIIGSSFLYTIFINA